MDRIIGVQTREGGGGEGLERKQRTYEAYSLRSDVAQREANPHQEEGDNLPRRVEDPLLEERHQRGAEREQDDPDDEHDHPVRQDDFPCPTAAATASTAGGYGAARGGAVGIPSGSSSG